MGQGSYIFCEQKSLYETNSLYQQTLAGLEAKMIENANRYWSPLREGYLTPTADQWGRTSILPPLFQNAAGSALAHFRQYFASSGNQVILRGSGSGYTIPEDFKVAWAGLLFASEQVNVSDLKWQIGDKKYGRVDIEEIKGFEKPALVFEEGFILDEEQSFELYGYVDTAGVYQHIVPLGFCAFRKVDKVLGDCGSAIT